MLNRLLLSLGNELPDDLSHIIRIQMENLKILPPTLPETTILELPHDQYRALSTITMYMGRNDGFKWPYYFITGSAGTGKSYVIKIITNMLVHRRQNFLLLAPTGVAAQNVGGKTIHSELRITSTQGGFYARAYTDTDLNI